MKVASEQRGRSSETRRFRQRGLSLVELLVGLAVGLFLIAGIIQLLVSSRVSYTAEENFSRLQENARYAVTVIARDARMVHNMGCRSLYMEEWYEDLQVVACAMLTKPVDCAAGSSSDPIIASRTPLGYDNSEQDEETWLVDLPESATAGGDGVDDRWARGDVLVAWGVTGPGIVMTNALDADTRIEPIGIEAASGDLEGGYLALVTNCAASDLFRISNAADDNSKALKHEGGMNATASMSHAYNKPVSDDKQTVGTAMKTMVYPFDYRVFFICEDNQTARDSLCRWSANSGRIDTLVNDVVDMRITYSSGDLDVDGDEFVDERADQLSHADWANVNTAHVELLVSSDEAVRTQTAPPSNPAWPGGDDDRLGAGLPDDRRRYERFAFTVAFRAKTPWYVEP